MCVYGWGGATSQEVHLAVLLILSHVRCRSLPAAVLCDSSVLLLLKSTLLHNTFYDDFCLICQMIYFAHLRDKFVSSQSLFFIAYSMIRFQVSYYICIELPLPL